MRKLLLTTSLILWGGASALAAPVVGEQAPVFTGTDTKGVQHSLSDFSGQTVVLEWNNPECPYVKKHYDSGNMQSLQEEATEEGVVWLTVNSGAEGKQGHMTAAEADAYMEEVNADSTAYLLDTEGEIGRMYDAKTTPHMYVINPAGTLVYAGAIDSDNSDKPESIDGATNYVKAAWHAVAADEPVAVATTQPYGCSVKY